MFLENERLKLRALEPEDLEILYKWENNTDLWIHGNSTSPYSKLALRQYICETQLHDIYEAKQLRLIIVEQNDENVVGTIDLYDFDPHNSRAGIGILIDDQFRDQNYATETLSIIQKYSFSFLKIKQLYAYIAVDNINSIKLFEKAGYTKSGMLSSWIQAQRAFKDVLIYQLLNKDSHER